MARYATTIAKNMEKANLADIRWINTPFAFIMMQRDLTLLQQRILIRVSDALQDYFIKFWKEGRKNLNIDPLCMFSDKDLENLPTVRVTYEDMEMLVSHKVEFDQAFNLLFDTKIRVLVSRTETESTWRWTHVFSHTNKIAEATPDGARFKEGELTINKDAVRELFNMNKGYVNHPSRITDRSARVYTFLLYASIKHHVKPNKVTVKIPYKVLREELGMTVYDKESNNELVVTKQLYSQFSRFRVRVLDPSIEDLNRMAALNQVDFYIDYSLELPAGRTQRGDPENIVFRINYSALGAYHRDPKDAKKHILPAALSPACKDKNAPSTSTQPRRRGRPRKQHTAIDNQPSIDFDAAENNNQPIAEAPKLKPGDNKEGWQKIIERYGEGANKRLLESAEYLGTLDGSLSIQMPDYPSQQEITNAAINDSRFKTLLQETTGKMFGCLKVSFKK